MLYNERIKEAHPIKEINKSKDLQRRFMDDRSYVYNLKYKNNGLKLNEFVDSCMDGKQKPYLECDHKTAPEDEI